MRSINTKLVRITIASVLITAFAITTFFIFFSRAALRSEAYDKLNEEASFVEKVLNDAEDIDVIRSYFTTRQILLENPFLSNRLILINDDRQYLPMTPNEDLNELNSTIVSLISKELSEQKNYISFYIDGKENVGIAYRIRIVTRTSIFTEQVRLGWLYIYVPLEEVEMDTVILRVFFIALILSTLIGATISIFFSGRITRPLSKLSLYSKMISERKFDDIKRIRTGDEIEKLSVDFMGMANELKKYDEQQREFFQNVSHNLKTPLMSIRGYAEAILDGVSNDREKALNIIINEADKLDELVGKIMFISKSESLSEFYRFEETTVSEIIQQALFRVNGIAQAKAREFMVDISGELVISADGEKMTTALTNILSNSLRYSVGKVMIKAFERDEDVVIIIEDDGDGFYDGEEEKVFDKYYKGRNGSFGLGLYITKMIINRHLGDIRAYNGQYGACFEIILKRRTDDLSDDIYPDI